MDAIQELTWNGLNWIDFWQQDFGLPSTALVYYQELPCLIFFFGWNGDFSCGVGMTLSPRTKQGFQRPVGMGELEGSPLANEAPKWIRNSGRMKKLPSLFWPFFCIFFLAIFNKIRWDFPFIFFKRHTKEGNQPILRNTKSISWRSVPQVAGLHSQLPGAVRAAPAQGHSESTRSRGDCRSNPSGTNETYSTDPRTLFIHDHRLLLLLLSK